LTTCCAGGELNLVPERRILALELRLYANLMLQMYRLAIRNLRNVFGNLKETAARVEISISVACKYENEN
jgi:hypothetical protein